MGRDRFVSIVRFSSTVLAALYSCAGGALADDADLARQLSNPVASLISVSFQFNYDRGYGPSDGERAYLNIQPVVPIPLNDDWTLISRTILPVIWQDDIAGDSGDRSGLSNPWRSMADHMRQNTKPEVSA